MTKIQEVLENMPMTVTELGRKIGLSKTSIYYYKNGKWRPSRPIIISIANALKLDTETLEPLKNDKINNLQIVRQDEEIGDKIKKARESLNMTVHTLANLCFMRPETLRKIEQNLSKPHRLSIMTLMEKLKLDENFNPLPTETKIVSDNLPMQHTLKESSNEIKSVQISIRLPIELHAYYSKLAEQSMTGLASELIRALAYSMRRNPLN